MSWQAALGASLVLLTLSACAPRTAATGDGSPALVARGHEPAWAARVDGARLTLSRPDRADEQLPVQRTPLPAGGAAFSGRSRAGALVLTVTPGLCRDRMTGMPHPLQAALQLGGERWPGCAGEPVTLLAGGSWQVTQLDGRAVPADIELSLAFLPADRVAGRSGCNRYMGGYALTGEGLQFRQLAGTLMACAGPAGEIERPFLAALAEVSRFDLSEQGELLLLAQEKVLLRARRP